MLPNSWILPNKEIWWEIISCSCFWVQSFFLQSSASCKASVLDSYTSAAAIFNSWLLLRGTDTETHYGLFIASARKLKTYQLLVASIWCFTFINSLPFFFFFFSVPLWCNFLQKTMALKVVETIATTTTRWSAEHHGTGKNEFYSPFLLCTFSSLRKKRKPWLVVFAFLTCMKCSRWPSLLQCPARLKNIYDLRQTKISYS